MLDAVIWGGAALTLLGVAGLLACVWMAWRAKTSGLTDEAIRQKLQRVVVLNLGALAVSALGLMAVVLGVMLS
ncbi:hypothetical protein [Neotabrizicola shimadae]|uniref:hypothetical protein n=1 Tax=Neotabrizicola shimadae TaxID=2807096 RepID=UPI0035C67DAC